MSRLLQELDRVIRNASSRDEWARAACRRAEILGRQGDTSAATIAISAVRTEYGHALSPDVAVWLMLTEGILEFYAGASDMGVGRLKRAHAMSAAMEGCAARSTCAGWMALYSLNNRRFDEMAQLLAEAFELARADDHQARARASLVLADGFHFGGRFDLARPWYDKTRFHAAAEGDESAISAMLHNVAAFRTANLKLADALGDELAKESRHASMEAASASAYDRAIGTRSFDQLLPHVHAQVLMIERRYDEAFQLLSQIDVSGLLPRVHAIHYADLATCASYLSKRDLVPNLVDLAEKSLVPGMDGDDVVYACSRLTMLYEGLGDAAKAAKSAARAKEQFTIFRQTQTGLVAKLIDVSERVGAK